MRKLKDIVFEMQKESIDAFNSNDNNMSSYGWGAITCLNILIKNKMLKDWNIMIKESQSSSTVNKNE